MPTGAKTQSKTESDKKKPLSKAEKEAEKKKQKKTEMDRTNSSGRRIKEREPEEEDMDVETSEEVQDAQRDKMTEDPTAAADWGDEKQRPADPRNPNQAGTQGAVGATKATPKIDRSTKPQETRNTHHNGSAAARASSKQQQQHWQNFNDEQEYGAGGWDGNQGHGQGYNQGQGYGQSHGHSYQGGYSQAGNSCQQHGPPRGGNQDQMQDLMFREAQASKQMVYGVFGNYITMMEEMESRELRKAGHKSLARSDIYLPDQKKFTDADVRAKLDTQLILLQCQLTSCHEGIKDEVKEELKGHTLAWSAAREDNKLPHGQTDKYAEKLFGLLEIGKADHPKEFSEPPRIEEKEMKQALGAIMVGNQKKSELDQSFKDDPEKKAAAPKTRKGQTIDHGADRMARENPKHQGAVDNHRSSWR